jgi:ribonuclease G
MKAEKRGKERERGDTKNEGRGGEGRGAEGRGGEGRGGEGS